MKSIKRQLKNETKNSIPDLYADIVQQAEDQRLFAEQSSVGTDSCETIAAHRPMQKWVPICIALFMIIALSVTSFSLIFRKTPNKVSTPSSIKLSVEDFYGIGAISSALMLESDGFQGQTRDLMKSVSTEKISNTTASDLLRSDIKTFDRYFTAFGGFMVDTTTRTKSEENKDAEFSDYSTKLTVYLCDILGNEAQQSIYYNEVLSSVKESEEDEEEYLYIFNGAMMLNGIRYKISGKRSVESDTDEIESALELKVYHEDDSASYTEIKQETSTEEDETETEYLYSVYKNNAPTEKISLKFKSETENGKVKTDFIFLFGVNHVRKQFKVATSDVSNPKLKVNYSFGTEKKTFTVRPFLNEAGMQCREYIFDDGSKIVCR